MKPAVLPDSGEVRAAGEPATVLKKPSPALSKVPYRMTGDESRFDFVSTVGFSTRNYVYSAGWLFVALQCEVNASLSRHPKKRENRGFLRDSARLGAS
ncbi:hypothetical protein [Falsiroseomonas sp. HW251]|uniref:hypothetical protein n=1 Tax=Falsiroseomonas sp. HW251 TaxID=3390998 RepID=UPI003D31B7C6